MGLCCSGEKKIYLRPNVFEIGTASLHELGHAIDSIYKISGDEEFLKCFEAEKEFIRNYAQTTHKEYFADIYMMYFRTFSDSFYTKYNFPESMTYLDSLEL